MSAILFAAQFENACVNKPMSFIMSSRYLNWYCLLEPTMGEEDWGGLPDLDPKSRLGFFNLPDLSRHFGISRDGHPDLLKSSR